MLNETQKTRVTQIDDGRRDLIVGDYSPGGAKIIITQEMLDYHKLNYNDFKDSGIEIGKLLMAFGLMLVRQYSPKTDELVIDIPSYDKIIEAINHYQPEKVSISWVQRKFSCGFNVAKAVWDGLVEIEVITCDACVNWEHKKLTYVPSDEE